MCICLPRVFFPLNIIIFLLYGSLNVRWQYCMDRSMCNRARGMDRWMCMHATSVRKYISVARTCCQCSTDDDDECMQYGLASSSSGQRLPAARVSSINMDARTRSHEELSQLRSRTSLRSPAADASSTSRRSTTSHFRLLAEVSAQ